jgi:WS/DGAT/MGAT family acyltransferase
MQKMRGADAYFLREESRVRHMHTLKIVVVDPSSLEHKISFDRVRYGATRTMPHLQAFRLRPLWTPLGWGDLVWLDSPQIDPDYHFQHVVLPDGAGEDELDELASRIASEPLDKSRPLWQVYFVEGLPEGRIAYVSKIHHAVADGLASAELVARMFRTTPNPVAPPPPPSEPNESVPAWWRLLATSLRREVTRQRYLPNLLWRSVREIFTGLRLRRETRAKPAVAFASPLTRFNYPLTPNRIFRRVTVSVRDLQTVKQTLGGTLNDVYLSIVGGAIRSYLELHGELPQTPTTAAIPVSVRTPDKDPALGNAIAQWFASTGSHIEDPVERLEHVCESTRVARELFAAQDSRLPVDWLDYWRLRWLYLGGFQRLVAFLTRRPSCTVIVSNVRGPQEKLYSDGAPIVALHSMGPLALQQGLNFTAWSYQDDFSIGLHACREHVPDLNIIADAIRDELDALLEVTCSRVGQAS